jgi:hypothetical protein
VVLTPACARTCLLSRSRIGAPKHERPCSQRRKAAFSFSFLSIPASLTGVPPASRGFAVADSFPPCAANARKVWCARSSTFPLARRFAGHGHPRLCHRACLCSRTPSRALATSPSRGYEPRSLFSFTKQSLWGTHDSPWDVPPCRRPLPSPVRLNRAAVPLGPASNTCRAAPKTQGGFIAHTEPHAAKA